MTAREFLQVVKAAAEQHPEAEVRVGWSYSEAGVEGVELTSGPDGLHLTVEADLSAAQKHKEARHLAFEREMAELGARETRA